MVFTSCHAFLQIISVLRYLANVVHPRSGRNAALTEGVTTKELILFSDPVGVGGKKSQAWSGTVRCARVYMWAHTTVGCFFFLFSPSTHIFTTHQAARLLVQLQSIMGLFHGKGVGRVVSPPGRPSSQTLKNKQTQKKHISLNLRILIQRKGCNQ